MMGHETLQMIHERYYSHIRNYQREDGTAFMEKVYKPVVEADETGELNLQREKCDPNVTQEEKMGSAQKFQPPGKTDKI
jgi:hypothetical protein